MADAVDYVSLQAIREDSGTQHYQNGEVPSGATNGTNKVFVVARRPLVDQNNDDIVSAEDVVAYVDGVPVEVQSINANTGAVTLAVAPAGGTEVTVDYAYSPLSDSTISGYRTKAQGWLRRRVKNSFDFTTIKDADDVPVDFQSMITLYASGLILIKDYGSSADTDESSKDGYKKLNLARDLMKEYLTDLADDDPSSVPSAPVASVKTDGEIFRRETDLTNANPSSKDDHFWRHND